MSKQHPDEESFKEQIMKSLNYTSDYEQKSKIPADSSTSRQPKPAIPEEKKETSKDQTKVSAMSSYQTRRNKEDRLVNNIVTKIILVLLVIGTIATLAAYSYISTGLRPLNARSDEKIVVEIPPGSSNKMIGTILHEEKVIKNGLMFNYYTKFNNLTGFQAGKYELSPNMSLEEIGKILQQGTTGAANADARITIPEGYDIEQIGDALAQKMKIDKKEFIALMKDDDFFDKLYKQYPELLADAARAEGVHYRLEGYLFPATYDYYKGATLEDIVSKMVDKTHTVMSQYYTEIKQKNLNVQEVLTLASLVEKEGVTEADRKNIAQVFFNRLEINMPLQSDIAILYALGEHKELVTIKDTQIDSPYNLYVHAGYGPGPFDNPSEQAIKAVLDPTPNDYYYFVADLATGKVYYAKDFDQHNELVEKYVNKTKKD